MKNEIKEITEIITRLQDCGRKRISRTEGVIVNNEDIATALYEAGYRKQSDTVKEFAEKIKASPNRDYSHSYQLGLLGLTENDINDLAEQYGKEE